MKHKHYKEIKKYIEDVEGQVVLIKSSLDRWYKSECPSWHTDYECKVILRKHLDVALAFLNEGATIQGVLNGEWIDLEDPAWSPNYEYRIKPRSEKRWVICSPSRGVVHSDLFDSKPNLSDFEEGTQLVEVEINV